MTKVKYVKGKNLTKNDFEQIKLLLSMSPKISKNQIASIVNRSTSTISKINQYDTLEALRAANRAEKAKYKKAPADTGVGTVSTDALNSVSQKQQETNGVFNAKQDDMLVRIADLMERQTIAMERLAEAWEKPSKKRLF